MTGVVRYDYEFQARRDGQEVLHSVGVVYRYDFAQHKEQPIMFTSASARVVGFHPIAKGGSET